MLAMLIPVVLSVAASGGVSFFMAKRAAPPAAAEAGAEGHEGGAQDEGHKAAPPAAANYVALDPAFTVNLGDPEMARFLQVQVELMTRDASAPDKIKAQTPRIRNALLMLFGQQKVADLATRAGKEKLQADVLAELQKIMKEETGKPSVDAVYFTSFVMQ